jgi:DNA-binding NarL/FixJ family response regulator
MTSIRVVLVDDHPIVRAGIRNLLAKGAAGYLIKEEAPEAIVEAVRGVARGERGWLSRRVEAAVYAVREGWF